MGPGAGPPAFAGLALDRPLIMGVVNVTPDSFSDGGETFDAAAAIARGRVMAEEGAAIIDVGGESTRPGAAPVSVDEELARVLPVVRQLAAGAAPGIIVSIDSRRAAVMKAAVDAGAAIINDITALEGDGDSLAVAAQAAQETGASVILMHMRGDPRTMQEDPRYQNAAREVHDYLAARVAAAEAAGIPPGHIAIDPGIGFGKTVDHNLDILAHLSLYRDLGRALVLGVSRKSFIARLSPGKRGPGKGGPGKGGPGKVSQGKGGRGEAADRRLAGSIAAGLAGIAGGAHILRVHDVAETRQALDVWTAIQGFREA